MFSDNSSGSARRAAVGGEPTDRGLERVGEKVFIHQVVPELEDLAQQREKKIIKKLFFVAKLSLASPAEPEAGSSHSNKGGER